jgi:hypothetical protein
LCQKLDIGLAEEKKRVGEITLFFGAIKPFLGEIEYKQITARKDPAVGINYVCHF